VISSQSKSIAFSSGHGVTISAHFDDAETAWQLAQFVKRVSFADVRQCARTNDEAYQMLNGLNAIRRALAEQGVAPR
jgi:hypothetical protein